MYIYIYIGGVSFDERHVWDAFGHEGVISDGTSFDETVMYSSSFAHVMLLPMVVASFTIHTLNSLL